MTLWKPPSVIAHERAEYRDQVLRNVTINDARARECTEWMHEHYDDRWFMVKAKDTVEPGAPVLPGYYHLLRNNEDAPISVILVHAAGAYVEPTSRILERVAAGDMRNPSIMRDMLSQDRRAHEEGERDLVRENEARRAELRERVNAAVRTQVSMNGDHKWTQNSSGRARDGRG